MFKDLTDKLERINFGMVNDIKIGVLQKQLFKDCPSACILTSIYNALPSLFKYNYNKVKQLYNELGLERVFNPNEVVKLINEKFENEILLYKEHKQYGRVEKKNLQKKIQESIDKNLSVVFSFAEIENINNHQNINGHAITLVGYNSKYYYAYDNSRNGNRIIFAFIENLLKSNLVFKKDSILGKLQIIYKEITTNKQKFAIEDFLIEHLKEEKYFIKEDKYFCAFDKNIVYELFDWINIITINESFINELKDKLRKGILNLSTYREYESFDNIVYDFSKINARD